MPQANAEATVQAGGEAIQPESVQQVKQDAVAHEVMRSEVLVEPVVSEVVAPRPQIEESIRETTAASTQPERPEAAMNTPDDSLVAERMAVVQPEPVPQEVRLAATATYTKIATTQEVGAEEPLPTIEVVHTELDTFVEQLVDIEREIELTAEQLAMELEYALGEEAGVMVVDVDTTLSMVESGGEVDDTVPEPIHAEVESFIEQLPVIDVSEEETVYVDMTPEEFSEVVEVWFDENIGDDAEEMGIVAFDSEELADAALGADWTLDDSEYAFVSAEADATHLAEDAPAPEVAVAETPSVAEAIELRLRELAPLAEDGLAGGDAVGFAEVPESPVEPLYQEMVQITEAVRGLAQEEAEFDMDNTEMIAVYTERLTVVVERLMRELNPDADMAHAPMIVQELLGGEPAPEQTLIDLGLLRDGTHERKAWQADGDIPANDGTIHGWFAMGRLAVQRATYALAA